MTETASPTTLCQCATNGCNTSHHATQCPDVATMAVICLTDASFVLSLLCDRCAEAAMSSHAYVAAQTL